MKIFKEIEVELKVLVEIARECGKYNEMLLRFNNSNSKDFNEEKCKIIQSTINTLEQKYTDIYFKYF